MPKNGIFWQAPFTFPFPMSLKVLLANENLEKNVFKSHQIKIMNTSKNVYYELKFLKPTRIT